MEFQAFHIYNIILHNSPEVDIMIQKLRLLSEVAKNHRAVQCQLCGPSSPLPCANSYFMAPAPYGHPLLAISWHPF